MKKNCSRTGRGRDPSFRVSEYWVRSVVMTYERIWDWTGRDVINTWELLLFCRRSTRDTHLTR